MGKDEIIWGKKRPGEKGWRPEEFQHLVKRIRQKEPEKEYSTKEGRKLGERCSQKSRGRSLRRKSTIVLDVLGR